MKTLRMLLLASVMLAGIVASAAPILAATQKPIHPTAGYIQDGQPTPTPIPPHTDSEDGCSAGC